MSGTPSGLKWRILNKQTAPGRPTSLVVLPGAILGSVAKIGWGRKKPGPDFSLGGNLEEALHESYLSTNVAFPDSFNLPFSPHMHRLISTDGLPRRLETEEAESRIDSPWHHSFH
jgi:hypothetical protein